MISSLIRDLYNFLDTKQRKQFLLFQFLIILSAVFETLSVLSIAPFMAIASDYSIIDSSSLLTYLYNFFSLTSKKDFVVLAGIFVLCIFFHTTLMDIHLHTLKYML